MGLFDRHSALIERYAAARDAGMDPLRVRLERVLSPTEAIVNGQRTLMVGTNNYLGLTFDESCVESAVDALRAEGTGTTGSRTANGSYDQHESLERELAEFYGMDHCMVFSTGFQANLGTIATLVGEGDYLIIDADSHASIYDACKMTAATVIRFRHNDAADLEKRLRRLNGTTGNKLVVVEGIYSMLGDKAPLKAICDVTKSHGAYLLVDEAHSLGVLGEHGRGMVEEAGILDRVDFVVGTFSKTLGAVGGFCVSNHPEFENLRLLTRPYMFTASLPPSIIASVRQALRTVSARPDLRARLWHNVDTLYAGLEAAGFRLGSDRSPVVAVHMPDLETTTGVWKALLDAGIYVNLAGAFATPNGVSLLRCSVCAAHTREQLEHVVETLTRIAASIGLLPRPVMAAAG